MLPQEEFVEIHALRKRGWSISAIARHLGRDRKTVRAHLAGKRQPGRRRPSGPVRFEKFEPYLHQRLADDPHVWGTVLHDELRQLGYSQSYPTFVRQLRWSALRPPCRVKNAYYSGRVCVNYFGRFQSDFNSSFSSPVR